MKIIKIIFLSFLALSLIVCTGIFILFETFNTDQYLPHIAQKASLALGRPVSIRGIGLGLSSRGITLDLGPVIVADDPNFTTQPFIKVDRVRISLDLKALILRREVHITHILLQSPQIHFIRSEEGIINAQSIGQRSRSVIVQATTAVSASSVIASEAKVLMPDTRSSSQSFDSENRALSPIIQSIQIQDAAISFIDQSQSMPLDIWLLNINANLSGFSLSKPFGLSFHASPLVFKSTSPDMMDNPVFKNISGAGTGQFNMDHLEGSITVTDGVIKNFNIIKTILSHTLGSFGGLQLNMGKLGEEDTIIEKASAEFSFHDKTVFLDDSLIKTNIFEFTAKGSVDQGLSMDMQTMLHLNTDISAALINELDGLKFLCDDSKRITIGASLKGVIPHLKYKPDKSFRKNTKKAFMEQGGSILGVLLGGLR